MTKAYASSYRAVTGASRREWGEGGEGLGGGRSFEREDPREGVSIHPRA